MRYVGAMAGTDTGSGPTAPTAPAAPPRHLAFGAAVSVLAQGAPIFAAGVLSIVLARTVGPSGNGAISLIVTLLGLLSLIFGVGLTAGFTFEVSGRRWPVGAAMRTGYRLALGLGIVATAAGLGFLVLTRHSVLGGVGTAAVVVALASLPAYLAYQFASSIALGHDRYETYGALELTHAIGMLLMAAVLALFFGVLGAAIGVAASGFLAAAVGWIMGHRDAERGRSSELAHDAADDRTELRRAGRFGLQSWVANLLQQVNYRFDLILLGGFASTRDVGLYSVAITITAIAWILPQALQTVIFPRTASLDAAARAGTLASEDSDAAVVRAIRHSVLLLIPAGLLVAVLLLVAVPLVYGQRFHHTIVLGFLLLPGVLILGAGKVLSSVITGRGKPSYTLYAALASVPVTLALYFTLIPAHHATGAALASSISYVFTTVVTAALFHRLTAISLVRALIPRPSDLRDYGQALGVLRSRLR